MSFVDLSSDISSEDIFIDFRFLFAKVFL